ncbi:MAG: tetratricopeptide repeat protein, partial [Nitrospiraceae bacterium]
MPGNKKGPIRANDRKSSLRAHKRSTAEAVKKNILLEEAIGQMNAGKYGQASAVLKELLVANPDNLEARRLFATLHLKLGSLMAAKTAFESLAQEAVQRQDYWLAESLLREYLAAGPRCVPFRELLGRVQEEKGDPMSAAVEYGKAIEILVEDPDPDEPNKAADLFAKIKEIAPTSPAASRFASILEASTGFRLVAEETTAEVNAPPAPAGVTEPAVEPPTESVAIEAEEIPAPAEPESSAERDPLLPSLNMAPEVEAPPPDLKLDERQAEPAALSLQDGVDLLPPLPPEVLAELGLILPESEEVPSDEPAIADTKEVDPILPSLELAPTAASEIPPGEEVPESAATGASVQADSPLPSLELAPATEVEALLPEPMSVTEPDLSATSTPALQVETTLWQAPPPEPAFEMGRLAEPAIQETPTAGHQFMEEAEVPPPETGRVMEPEPEPVMPPAWQVESPPWQPTALEPAGHETPAAGYRFMGEAEASMEAAPVPPSEPLKVRQPEPELAMARMYPAAGETFGQLGEAAHTEIRRSRTARSLASRVAGRVAYVGLRISLFVRGCIAAARFVALSALAAVTISLVLTVLFVGVVSLLWFSLEQKPNGAYHSLTKPPSRALHDPKRNGYLLLLGFGASGSRDPVQAGYEITLTKAEKDKVNLCLNDGAGSPLPLRFEATTSALSRWFRAPDPAAYFQNQATQVRNWMARHDVLMSRYRQWLRMSFDDWGFGELGTPDCGQILVAHRLHVADGFSHEMGRGVERLESDLAAWRTVLAQAKTLSIKMMAAEAINDDVAVISGLLTRPELPVKLLPNLAALGRPLDELELSLRWPMQNHLVLEA